jgi:predicted transcriptional regulator
MKKQKIIDIVNEFPGEVDLNQLFERLVVKEKIDKGLKEIETGATVSHEEVKELFRKKWQK